MKFLKQQDTGKWVASRVAGSLFYLAAAGFLILELVARAKTGDMDFHAGPMISAGAAVALGWAVFDNKGGLILKSGLDVVRKRFGTSKGTD